MVEKSVMKQLRAQKHIKLEFWNNFGPLKKKKEL